MCLYNRIVQNPKYKANKKNGGNPPDIYDRRVLAVPVGCGQCMECRKQKQREWTIRLQEETRTTKLNIYFVTLTFSSENYIKLLKRTHRKGYEGDNAVATLATRRFLERWRKHNKRSVRHWFVTELGGGRYEHLHIHGLIYTELKAEEIEKRWQYGFVKIQDYASARTVNYIVKYMHKEDEKHKGYKPIVLCSKGIGQSYKNRNDIKRNEYKENNTIETYRTENGKEVALPRYYRNMIYNEEEREKLWIEKLNKNERWVDGIKIDISTKEGEKKYKKAVRIAKDKSIRLGYGKPISWNEKQYEKERRILIQEQRGESVREKLNNNNIIKGHTPKIDEW